MKKTIVFGTGVISKEFVEQFNGDIAFFVDNNSEKWEKTFLGKLVHNPAVWLEESKEDITIFVASMYYEDISQQLKGMGFVEDHHFHRAKTYYKDGFYCPCCDNYSKSFLPYGVKQRLNAQCPKCFSLERHRLIWMYLKERTDIFKGTHKVLNIAPEFCFQSNLKRLPNLDYTSADLNSPLAMIKMDITNIPYPDNSFDIIICNHVLEHIDDERKAMGEIFRVLKPGGWAILQVPINQKLEKTFEDSSIIIPEGREKHFGQSDHVRWYGRDYQERLENIGFVVKADDFARKIESELIHKYCLDINEDIFFCIK